MNQIEKVRLETNDCFKSGLMVDGTEETIISPSKNFTIKTVTYKENNPSRNFEMTHVEIFETDTSQLKFSLLVNEGTFFHAFAIKNDTEYLLCAEDLCGGQTVIDLTNNIMASYTEDQDGFIWCEHFLSPDANMLAVVGCGWGSPYFVVLYDFEKPMQLPLKEIKQIDLISNSEQVIGWINNTTIKLKSKEGIERFVTV